MFYRLLLLFTAVPLVELALLVWLGSRIGFWATMATVLGMGILGASLARWQGMRTLSRIQSELSAGRVPSDALVDGLLIIVAGVLLVTPGVLTDAFGFGMLIPPVRRLLKQFLIKRFSGYVQIHRTPFTPDLRSPFAHDDVVDARFVDPLDHGDAR
jgi:UPF0716 protein FxsA